ncbi:hypothetical protein BS639_17425 [Rouxiella silvae]|uniref:Uncharacterized protein n=1 Tax=Rouxiella silvae TaxID=1646373 RepID=A0ABX3TXI3_9GAMM|nr:hypothetical protein [Rouxiella silvae]ORJ19955.1 hypothetical protein BS639_17425 [Rouxiella silvae]
MENISCKEFKDELTKNLRGYEDSLGDCLEQKDDLNSSDTDMLEATTYIELYSILIEEYQSQIAKLPC